MIRDRFEELVWGDLSEDEQDELTEEMNELKIEIYRNETEENTHERSNS